MPRKMPNPYEPPEAFPVPHMADARDLAPHIRRAAAKLDAAARAVEGDPAQLIRLVESLDLLRVAGELTERAQRLTAEYAMASRQMTQLQISQALGVSKTKINGFRALPVAFDELTPRD